MTEEVDDVKLYHTLPEISATRLAKAKATALDQVLGDTRVDADALAKLLYVLRAYAERSGSVIEKVKLTTHSSGSQHVIHAKYTGTEPLGENAMKRRSEGRDEELPIRVFEEISKATGLGLGASTAQYFRSSPLDGILTDAPSNSVYNGLELSPNSSIDLFVWAPTPL